MLYNYILKISLLDYMFYMFLTCKPIFHVNHMLFTIRFIKSYFIHYFKQQKLDFNQLIDNIVFLQKKKNFDNITIDF